MSAGREAPPDGGPGRSVTSDVRLRTPEKVRQLPEPLSSRPAGSSFLPPSRTLAPSGGSRLAPAAELHLQRCLSPRGLPLRSQGARLWEARPTRCTARLAPSCRRPAGLPRTCSGLQGLRSVRWAHGVLGSRGGRPQCGHGCRRPPAPAPPPLHTSSATRPVPDTQTPGPFRQCAPTTVKECIIIC